MSEIEHELTNIPSTELDTTDPGDDVQLRFRYQHCYAAINSLRLILPDSDVQLILCENHEDIVVQTTDDLFTAVQVKTRDVSQKPFKATDKQVISAFSRFCLLDKKFDGAFKCFEFLTNFTFWEDKDNSNNLPFILSSLKKRGKVKGLKHTNPMRKFVKAVCDSSGLKEEEVVSTLLKSCLNAKNDNVISVEKDVLEALAECPGMSEVPFFKLRHMVGRLIELMNTASSKGIKGSIFDLYEAGNSFSDVLTNQSLSNKMIRKKDIDELAKECLSDALEFEQLQPADDSFTYEPPKDLDVMFKKLERGELETIRIFEIQDLVRSWNHLHLKWVNKYGASEANDRIQDLLETVKFDCTEARVKAEKNGEPFGSLMFETLVNLLRERCQNESEKVYGCRAEHLLGAAGSLTENCKAWWSQEFEIESANK